MGTGGQQDIQAKDQHLKDSQWAQACDAHNEAKDQVEAGNYPEAIIAVVGLQMDLIEILCKTIEEAADKIASAIRDE